MNEFAQSIVFIFGSTHDSLREIFIRKTERSSETILDQGFRKSAGKIILKIGGNQFTQLEEVLKGWPVMKFSGGINFMSSFATPFFLTPFT